MYTYTLPTYYIQRTMFFTSTYCRVRDFVLLQMWGRTLYSFGELLIKEFLLENNSAEQNSRYRVRTHVRTWNSSCTSNKSILPRNRM